MWNNNQSLTAGVRGPVLLEDYHLLEKIAQFDRERIPERVVHARGASAKGFFEVIFTLTHFVPSMNASNFLPIVTKSDFVVHFRSPMTSRT